MQRLGLFGPLPGRVVHSQNLEPVSLNLISKNAGSTGNNQFTNSGASTGTAQLRIPAELIGRRHDSLSNSKCRFRLVLRYIGTDF